MAPPNPQLADMMDASLRQKYPSGKPRALADLMAAYWADPANGNNQGRPKGGDAMWAHWGGPYKMLNDRQWDYWKSRGPV